MTVLTGKEKLEVCAVMSHEVQGSEGMAQLEEMHAAVTQGPHARRRRLAVEARLRKRAKFWHRTATVSHVIFKPLNGTQL